MAYNVSNNYKQVIYSSDAKNKLKLLFNNVELENADLYCEKMTVKSRIIANGAKVFSLNNFISKEIELILHDIDTSIIQDQVSISVGTLVGNTYEYVPIGIFNIQDTPTNDKDKTIIKLRDNSVKFDFNYNAQPLIDENGGSATKLQILQDICTQAGVTCNITSFIGYLDEIGIYDNTITARQYIANIAEQAGKIATINRNGELIFIDLNNLTTWEIPIDIVEKYENGTSFKIGQIVYEDGIVRYETPASNDDTLFLDGSNNYINGELIKEQASSNDNSYYLTNTGESDLVYLELEGKTTQEGEPTFDNPSELISVGYKNLYNKYCVEVETTSENNNTNTYLYQLDNPIRSIENIRDLFYIKNNMLYVERKIGSVVLNGTETWTHDTTGQRYWRALDNVVTPADVNTKGQGMSNIALLTANQTIYTSGMDGIAIHPLGRIYISNDVYDTLTTKNVELQYLYANPFVEELGTIEMPQAYNAVTNISINSGIITNSYIEYRKDKTQLEAILNEVNLFDIDSLKTGKILGNPAIDPYDLIQIHDKSKNLFDLDTYLDNAPLVNCTIEKVKNGFIMNFTAGVDAMVGATFNSGGTLPTQYRDGVIKVEPNTTYTISLSSSPKTYISYFNENYVATQNYTKLPVLYTPSKYTFTTNATTQYLFLRLGIQDSNYSSWIYQDVQVEKGNAATSYIPFKDETYITLATNDLTYTGVMINTFDTQIEEEAKEQNVFINGEEAFKKWARTKIDNVEGSITLQAGEINEANGRINETNLRIDKDGALLSVLANNSNIDVEYDSQGNPLSGEVREVTTTTGFTFNAEGMTIQDTSSNFRALHRNDGTYYYDGTTIVGQYTKDGSKQKDLDLFGIYTYGKNDIDETPMFIAQLFTDGNGEEGFGHFYNRGD